MKLSKSQRKYIRDKKAQIRRQNIEGGKEEQVLFQWIQKEFDLKKAKAIKHSS